MEQNQNNSFQYTYSAKEQKELYKIREKYSAKPVTTLDQIKYLDKKVTKKAVAVSVIIGIIGVLLMGSGMSLVMTNIGEILGIQNNMLYGIIIGIVGMLIALVAYPIYKSILTKSRKKIAPEIIRLTDELMK